MRRVSHQLTGNMTPKVWMVLTCFFTILVLVGVLGHSDFLDPDQFYGEIPSWVPLDLAYFEVLLTSLCLSDLGKLNIVNGAVSTGADAHRTGAEWH